MTTRADKLKTLDQADHHKYIEWMRVALSLAEKGRNDVGKNPMVGALIIDNDEVIASGYHEGYGKAHAEVNAVNDALKQGGDLSAATLIVTLEPCCHYGKTPPCTELILKSGFKRVIVAMEDPNPLVAGKGTRILRNQGIEVIVGVLEEEAKKLNEVFLHHIKSARPFVTMKTAMTLDGKIATCSGDSKWISGERSRHKVHELRQGSSAIMVGIGTVLADDPLLNTRLSEDETSTGALNHPIPIIVDSRGRIPLDSRVLDAEIHEKVIIATTSLMSKETEAALLNKNCTVLRIEKDNEVDLVSLMEILYKEGITSILLEGGSTLNFSMLNKGLVSKVISFIAPKFIGGSKAKSPVGGQGIDKMSEAISMDHVSYSVIGEDLMIEGYIKETHHKGGHSCLQDS